MSTGQISKKDALELKLLKEQNDELVKRVYELSVKDRDNRNLVNLLFDQFPYGIVLLNDKRQVLQVNRAAADLLCVNNRQLIGQTCDHVFDCFAKSGCCPVIDEDRTIEQERTACIGSSKRFIRSAIVNRDTKGELTILETFSDITAIDEAQRATTQVLQSKSNFLSNVSHELRTPMHGILGYSELLESELEEHPQALELLQPLKNSAKSLWALIERLLEATKIEDNQIKLLPTTFRLENLMHSLQSELEQIVVSDIRLEFEYPASVEIYTDQNRVHQILMLLLRNAVKYSGSGLVKCEASVIEGDTRKLVVQIIDTGIGISEEKQKVIFEMFEQGDGSSTRHFEGIGLGLSIARRLTNFMGGDIELKSAEGRGATFTVTIPV